MVDNSDARSHRPSLTILVPESGPQLLGNSATLSDVAAAMCSSSVVLL